jgi:general secretion pathway protein K
MRHGTRSSRASARPASQGGAALVIVLWLLLLLSIMAAAHARNAHIETRLATRSVAAAEARQIADAAIELAIRDLLADSDEAALPRNGTSVSMEVLGQHVRLSLRPAAGLLDLNSAGEDTLRAVFAWGGATRERAIALAAAVLDWRDRDDAMHLAGAEADAYIEAGSPWTPRNDKFLATDELRYVLGMDNPLFRRVAPLLTVYSGRSGIDYSSAPTDLLSALGAENRDPRAATSRSGTDVFHITASINGRAGVVVATEVVVAAGRRSGAVYQILSRRERSGAYALATTEAKS